MISFSVLYFPFSINYYGEVNEQRRNWGTYWSTNNSPAGQASELAVSFSSESSLHQWASGLKHFAPPAHTASPCFSVGRGIFQSGLLKEEQKMFMTADNNECCLKVSFTLTVQVYFLSEQQQEEESPPGVQRLVVVMVVDYSSETDWAVMGGQQHEQHEWTTGWR